MNLKVVSYNIHKGMSLTGVTPILTTVRSLLERVEPDIVMLQEVIGDHSDDKFKIDSWPNQAQFEFLADKLWPHYAYGKNAVYEKGHHGNCILSKYPVVEWENTDISTNSFEKRGLLHAKIEIPATKQKVDLVCTHLNLLAKSRYLQILKIIEYTKRHILETGPLIFSGDFNDWQSKVTRVLASQLNLKEAFKELHGDHAKTFPNFKPFLKLDRIYYKNLTVIETKVNFDWPMSHASDHLPLYAQFSLPESNQET